MKKQMRLKAKLFLLVAMVFSTAGVVFAQDDDPVEKAPKIEVQSTSVTVAPEFINCELSAPTICDFAIVTCQTSQSIEKDYSVSPVAELPSAQVVNRPFFDKPKSQYIPAKVTCIPGSLPAINGPPKV